MNREYKSISLDGTVKPVYTLMGQPKYLASKREKASHATPPTEQKGTLLTGLGLTGAVIILKTARSEGSVQVAEVLSTECTPSQLFDVEHVAVDNPSEALFDELKDPSCCVNLRVMSLCMPHLAFAYERFEGLRPTRRPSEATERELEGVG